jgi:undecaprenyl-diphosphatase
MSVLHAVILALLQGAFELFPVSSLGHTVLVPALLGWDLKQSDPSFLAYVVVLHLGTAAALLLFFWRDWLRIIGAVLRSVAARRLSDDPDERLGWFIIVGSIPAGLLGLLFKDRLLDLFDAPGLVAIFLILNGLLLLGGERLRQSQRATAAARSAPDEAIAELGFRTSLLIGTAQALALLPGFSRSGSTMVGGLLARLNHEDAARFSFMLATPLILAAGIVSVPDLFTSDANVSPGVALLGLAISGATAFLTVRFLVRYFETKRLDIFGTYCIAFALVALVVLAARGSLT